MTQYLIGFDRFIALEWANYAFELSCHSENGTTKVSDLKSWLSTKISGSDSIRKTANVLSRLWLSVDDENQYFKNEACRIAIDARKTDWVIFHWGMALVTFPFFREVCFHAGRLLALQESITRRDLHIRLSEKYSNLGTVPRSIDRVLQSLVDWKLLDKITSQKLTVHHHRTSDILVKKWLLETIVFSAAQKRIPFSSFYKLPELFAFEYNGDVAQLVSNSSNLRIDRDGANIEYLAWKT